MIKAKLVKRYKRFLADVLLFDGKQITVHCPNPGAMTGLMEEGAEVWLKPSAKSAKLPYAWQMVRTETSLVGINAARANAIVYEALRDKKIPCLSSFRDIRPEVRIDEGIFRGTRLDFCLSNEGEGVPYYLEVKSVTLKDDHHIARFPDAKTVRGLKHLECLLALKKTGYQAGVLFLIQRSDTKGFGVAASIDPEYAKGYIKAKRAGIDVHAWDCSMNAEKNTIALRTELECID